ncbi:MAG: choice-of-anchor V domain-containing protein [Candidatus Zixiibacteriota bacterium]
MKHRLISILFFFAFLAAVSIVWAYSSGAPSAVTGAPGEGTCADCHDNLNTGSGSATILAPGGYTPGDTLDITAWVQNNGQVRWGFELTVLDGNDQAAGQIIVTDAARTQLNTSGGRQYITHTSQGTDDGTPDSTSWSFQWVAPDPDVGQVTFYMAGLAANSGNGANGDSTYTTTHVMAATDVAEVITPQLPERFSLSQNYPNPFNPMTTIEFYLPHRTHVKLSVFNMLGQRIRDLYKGIKSAGSYAAYWDGTDSHGNPVASGVYYYRLETDNFTESKKMILLK